MQQLAITTVGQVVSPGQALLTVVPDAGPIEVEAMVTNEDIGFVVPGQRAVVKVEAFPFTRYGTIDGTVRWVSRDAVAARDAGAQNDAAAGRPGTAPAGASGGQGFVFPAIVSLGTDAITVDQKTIPLSAGLAVTVEIKTGERRVIDYLLAPLREVADQSGHER